MKTAESTTRRRTRRHALVRVAQITILVAATWILAVPQFPKAWAAFGDLRTAQPGLVLLSAVAALLALVTYAQLMRTTLADGVRPGFWHTMGIIVTSLGVSNVVPAGSAAGSVMTFRMLERAGVARGRAMTAMALTSIGSALVLSVLLWIGLLTLLPTHGVASGALAAIPATGLLVLLAVVAHATSTRSPALWAMGAAVENRFPTTAAGRIVGTLNALALELDGWRRRPADLRRALFWATLNWVIDAAALWIILAAFGQRLGPSSVLVAFALANLAAMIPLTPGGLGVVELTITATLVGLGASAAPTAIGVAVYRLFNYWMPIPISALTYFATRSLTRDCALARDTAPPIQVGHRPLG